MVTCIHLAASNGSANCLMEGQRLDAIRSTSKVIVSGTGIPRCVEYRIQNHIIADIIHDIITDFHYVVFYAGLCVFGSTIPIQE